MTQEFSRYVCWKSERIGSVINKEALSVDRADFLATHVPMRQIAYLRAPHAVKSAGEEELLRELHRQADDDQHAFVIIRGAPGTGKSHLIRWLKERYAVERPRDAVLLIERANTSLRSTLSQIIDSGLFDRAGLPESLQRLQNAVTELSAEALADNLLDQIKTGTLEVDYPDLPNRLKPEKIYQFLLDVVIREQLKTPGGPIERITNFLSIGREDNAGVDEPPGFEPDDFVFGPHLLRKLVGYPEARKVANDLGYKPELREALAKYLNHLLRGYAISRATRLSTQDLREMFHDLRRHLRQIDTQLALFIEDITAFTGIDEGLLDVLVTQHLSEGNNDFCRLTSVIGLTDAYFSDYLPDNVKERATHQLTLSSDASHGVSDLMNDRAVRTEFAARYLNAMRVGPGGLDQWVRSGASPTALPIACDDCPYMTPCHTAFGAVSFMESDETKKVGLYPFNEQALDTLYRGLREYYPRTPRTYLFDLLGYILQSHGEKVALGTFPPSETDVAPAVQPPLFNPPAHRQIVESQGGTSAARLATLLLFWGDRSATHEANQIGSLSAGVFRAFGVKVIEGAPISAPPGDVPISTVAPLPSVVPDESQRYTRLIDTWMTTGRLSYYDRFAEWLADFIISFVDWQLHGVSLLRVKEYITQGHIQIEGQTGVAQRRHRLFFAKTPELRYVLQALADLNTNRLGLGAAEYGQHLPTLSAWIRAEEPRIVAFVREPGGLQPPPDYLLNILARNVMLLACLAGELRPSDGPYDWYYQIVASCAENRRWDESINDVKDNYPFEWGRLMKEINKQDAVAKCRTALLQLLNRPQGRSEAVRYLDASRLLGILRLFEADDLVLPDLEYLPESMDVDWAAATAVYNTLREAFPKVLDACFAEVEELNHFMLDAIGEDTPAQMLDTMRYALQGLRSAGISYDTRLDEPFSSSRSVAPWTPQNVESLLAEGNMALQSATGHERAVAASSRLGPLLPALRAHVKVLSQFAREMETKSQYLATEIAKLSTETDAAQGYERALSRYDELDVLMQQIT